MKAISILFLFMIFSCGISFGQIYFPEFGNIVNKCSNDTIHSNLQKFESLGIKEIGSTALNDTKNWIIDKYSSYGYTDIVEDSFNYYWNYVSNIIITKTGLVFPDKYVIIGGHYDTENGVGTNDNGSGTVALLEIARLLKDVDTDYSIKFIHFTLEEIGIIGSQHYVNSVVIPNDLDIKLVLNIDGVGGVHGLTNNTIVCERDESGPPFTNNEASAIVTKELAKCVRLYSDLATEISHAYASDYIPFEWNDEIITGLYEKNISPYYHSPDDVLSNMDVDYVYEVTKAAIGASLHFSVAYGLEEVIEHGSSGKIVAYPNPTKDEVTVDLNEIHAEIEVTLINTLGQLLVTKQYEAADHFNISIDNQPTGLYFLMLETSSGASKTIKIFKE